MIKSNINKRIDSFYHVIINALNPYFPNKKYTTEKLNAIETQDSLLQYYIKKMKYVLEVELDEEWIEDRQREVANYKKYFLNLNYNDRAIVGDDADDILDIPYGSSDVSINQKDIINHATYVAGILTAKDFAEPKIKNHLFLQVKLMPLVIACAGDEFEKDIALAIQYTVDNGANIINMSFGNEFEMHNDWVIDAVKYAANNNVLLVKSAGNSGHNLDSDDNFDFPSDYTEEGVEYVANFINVGASTQNLNKGLVSSFSNFGHRNVDVFAPGEEVYTTKANNRYTYMDGTSIAAPMVSVAAALVWSYYPELKASELKEIILNSGVSYDIEVEITNEKGEKELVPFSSLSKSGKIVNAYNALLMAEEYTKQK